MTQFAAPASVGQNIARAKSLVKRDDPIRALDALITALELFEPDKIIGKQVENCKRQGKLEIIL